MSKYKDRASKEAPYMIHNKDAESVCSGVFTSRNKRLREECKNREKCPKYAKFKESHNGAPQVGFYYVDTFRKCKLYKLRLLTPELVLQLAIYNIMYVNDLGCACIVDMKDKVYDQDKETKKIFGALLNRQWKYEKEITKILGKYIDILAEYNSEMDDKIQDKLATFYTAIYNFLESNRVGNARFIAYAELAYTIIDYSVNSIEKRVSECLKYNKDVVNLRQYKMLGMRDVSRNLCNWLCRRIKGLDMNNDENVVNAYRELDKALTDINFIDSSLITARNRFENAVRPES